MNHYAERLARLTELLAGSPRDVPPLVVLQCRAGHPENEDYERAARAFYVREVGFAPPRSAVYVQLEGE